MALSKPMAVSQSSVQGNSPGLEATFAGSPASLQLHGYYMYQFLDQESNTTPYNAGSYLGKKHVFNVGAGFLYQKDAMWHLEQPGGATIYSDLALLAVDVFYDKPLNRNKKTALTLYGAFHSNDYGKNYVRNLGVMNPTNGSIGQASFSGPGNAFPMMGTGDSFYGQAGYLMKKDLLGSWGTLQPFITSQISKFDLLDDWMISYEYGFNWLINENQTKLSLNYQSRPVFLESQGGIFSSDRKGMLVFQFQLAI